jgi:hypothetical protein
MLENLASKFRLHCSCFYVVVLEYTADPPEAGTTFIRGEKKKGCSAGT